MGSESFQTKWVQNKSKTDHRADPTIISVFLLQARVILVFLPVTFASVEHKEGGMSWTSSLGSAHLGSWLLPKCYYTSQARACLWPSVRLLPCQTLPPSAHCQCQVTLPWFSSDNTPQLALQNVLIKFMIQDWRRKWWRSQKTMFFGYWRK